MRLRKTNKFFFIYGTYNRQRERQGARDKQKEGEVQRVSDRPTERQRFIREVYMIWHGEFISGSFILKKF